MAQHQAAWKMCSRSRDREEETADKTALTLTPEGGGLGELLCFHRDFMCWRSLPVLIQGIPGAFVLHKQPPGAAPSTNTHGFNWGWVFFHFHCSHMLGAVTFLSSVCIWMAASSLSCLSHASLRQAALRVSASTNDSVLSAARAAQHLLPSLAFPS